MKRIKYILMTAMLVFALSSCEKVMEFDKQDDIYDAVVLNVVASTDTTLYATTTRSIYFAALNTLYKYDMYLSEYVGISQNPTSAVDRDWGILINSQVTYSVNGGPDMPMAFDSISRNYISDYRPLPGDHISVRATNPYYKASSGSSVIPDAKRLEILSWDKRFNKYEAPTVVFNPEDYWWSSSSSSSFIPVNIKPTDMTCTDTIVNIRLRFTDPGGESNYYRLKVKNVALYSDTAKVTQYDPMSGQTTTNIPYTTYNITDVFSSDDPIFVDYMMYDGFGVWDPNFSNVFSDELFDGQTREIEVRTRMRKGVNPYIDIELQSLSRDLYYYLKSTMHYLVYNPNEYTESLRIHSNTDLGIGIVGSMATEHHIIRP